VTSRTLSSRRSGQARHGPALRLNHNGTLTVIADKLNRPTSVHFVGSAALIVTLNGEVWRATAAGHDSGDDHGHD
jgi:hypothetical protein